MKSDLDALMQARNLDAIMVLGNAEHNPPMYYFTGGGHVSKAVLFKKPGETAVLYCNAMEREEAEKSGLNVIPLRNGALEDLAKRPKEIFGERGITSGRVGVFGHTDVSMALNIFGRIKAELPELELVGEDQDSSIFMYAMESKDEKEAARVRRMGKVTTEVVGLVADYLTSCEVRDDEVLLKEDGSPVTIADVKSKIGLWLTERGAVDVEGCIFAIGRDAGLPHSTGNPQDLLRLGQTIVFDIFPGEVGGGYFYDFTRTWSLGYATTEGQKLYDEVKDVYDNVIENIDMNAPFKAYQKMVCDEFNKNGHQTPMHSEGVLTEGYVHSLGHGLGLNVHERPWSRHTSTDDNRLKPGTVFTIEPGLYYPERGMGVRIEDSYWMHPDGSVERLAEYPYDFVLPMKKWKGKK
jgi:Xaa-Pro aminopeptidase